MNPDPYLFGLTSFKQIENESYDFVCTEQEYNDSVLKTFMHTITPHQHFKKHDLIRQIRQHLSSNDVELDGVKLPVLSYIQSNVSHLVVSLPEAMGCTGNGLSYMKHPKTYSYYNDSASVPLDGDKRVAFIGIGFRNLVEGHIEVYSNFFISDASLTMISEMKEAAWESSFLIQAGHTRTHRMVLLQIKVLRPLFDTILDAHLRYIACGHRTIRDPISKLRGLHSIRVFHKEYTSIPDHACMSGTIEYFVLGGERRKVMCYYDAPLYRYLVSVLDNGTSGSCGVSHVAPEDGVPGCFEIRPTAVPLTLSDYVSFELSLVHYIHSIAALRPSFVQPMSRSCGLVSVRSSRTIGCRNLIYHPLADYICGYSYNAPIIPAEFCLFNGQSYVFVHYSPTSLGDVFKFYLQTTFGRFVIGTIAQEGDDPDDLYMADGVVAALLKRHYDNPDKSPPLDFVLFVINNPLLLIYCTSFIRLGKSLTEGTVPEDQQLLVKLRSFPSEESHRCSICKNCYYFPVLCCPLDAGVTPTVSSDTLGKIYHDIDGTVIEVDLSKWQLFQFSGTLDPHAEYPSQHFPRRLMR